MTVSIQPKEQVMIDCEHCNGTGKVAQSGRVKAWGTQRDRMKLAEGVKAGDRWIRIKSGLVATVEGPMGEKHHGCIPLLHQGGQRTQKWRASFAAEFTPENPPS